MGLFLTSLFGPALKSFVFYGLKSRQGSMGLAFTMGFVLLSLSFILKNTRNLVEFETLNPVTETTNYFSPSYSNSYRGRLILSVDFAGKFPRIGRDSVSVLLSVFRRETHPAVTTQARNYVDVYMKWKKDRYYDSIEQVHQSIELKRVCLLKNCITQSPDGCIPISEVSKRGLEFGIPIKVARFLRLYPSVFEEFTGPKYELPWFRLTAEAAEIDREEQRVYEDCRDDLLGRLKKFILMSKNRVLPLNILQGMLWYLGLPDDFLQEPEKDLDRCFSLVDMGDGIRGLAVDTEEKVLSVLQKNAMKKGLYSGGLEEGIAFPLFPSKGLRLRSKIEDWLKEFQKLPYVSPYDDFSNLDPGSDEAEKRLVGLLHELLCLFVDQSAERKKLLCLKKHLALPQKVHKAFERHPHIFYLSLRNKTCTAILKEPYNDKSAIERHPLSRVRNRYINLMKQSDMILIKRRVNSTVAKASPAKDLDLDYAEEDGSQVAMCTV